VDFKAATPQEARAAVERFMTAPSIGNDEGEDTAG
jgi:hypothetical protein